MKAVSTILIISTTLTIAMAATLVSKQARADDQFFILDGSESRDNTSPVQKTNTYQAEFEHDFSNNFSWSIDYDNQGHFNQGIEHHRDFDAANLWAHTDLFDHQLQLAAAVGPLFYYDTTGGTYLHSTEDVHGFGASYTLAATLYTFRPLLLQVRSTWVDAGSFNTRALMVGVGYEFGGKSSSQSRDFEGQSAGDEYNQTRDEITFYGGKSVINLSGDGHSNAFGLEYRQDLSDYLQWTAGFLDEGKSALADRRGVTSELWLAKSFFDNRLSLGAGAGLYLAQDSMRPADRTFVTPMRSYTVAYRITPHLTVRTTWDRVITLGDYNRDSDVVEIGLGYRF